MRKYLIFSLALSFTLSTLFVADLFAAEEGAQLLDSRCSACHSSERAKSKQKTLEQWDTTVSRMMKKGAQLSPEEKQTLLEHLSMTYKP